jgi:hypothetical protein
MSKVYANGRSVVHKGDGQVNTCAVPDVCKTPSPAGPVPIPYVNVARDGDLAKGSKSVSIEGNPVALKDSNLCTSSGDEPGTAGGGLISSKTKGKMTWASASIDVKFEGKGVVRFMEPTQHNGNTFNTAFIQQGGTGFAYGDDPVQGNVVCPRCEKPKSEHAILETPDVRDKADELIAKLESMRKNPKNSNLKFLRRGEGYMVGVLLCKGGQIFAAMSGQRMLTGFEAAVQSLGWNLCGPVDFKKMHDCNGLIRFSAEVFAKLDPDDYPLPGNCAAPKLIQEALRAGHQPAHMSERYYSPVLNGSVEVSYQHTIINLKTGKFKKSWEPGPIQSRVQGNE